jgi:hypothetical protein
MVTFCLAPAQRAELQDAVVALEIDERGALNDLPAWRKAHPERFERACAALYVSRKGVGASDFATVLPFLTGLFSAMLAFLAATFVDRRARGRTLGDELRTAASDFHEHADVYLRGVKVGESDVELVAARRKLVDRLAGVTAVHPKWDLVADVRNRLTAGGLGPGMTEDWDDDVTRSAQRVRELTEQLDYLRDKVLVIAAALAVVVGSRKAVREES